MSNSNYSRIAEFTPREIEIIKQLAAGKSNKEIAATLEISVETVKSHMKRIFSKLSTTERSSAAIKAMELGVIENNNRPEPLNFKEPPS